jgi:DNA-binding MurR/RpiR family transcriptional regulator
MAQSPYPRRLRDTYGERLNRRRERLSPGLLAVAEYIDGHRHAVLGLSALEIGFQTGTSDATVIRAIQALGFGGLRELKETLDAWLGQTDSPVEKMATTVDALADSDAAIDFVIESQRLTLEALASPENRLGMAQAVALLAGAESVGVFGIGASGIIAQYAARLFDRAGLAGCAYNTTGIGLAEQLLSMRRGQVVVMLLHGRAHREAMTVIAEAGRLQIPVIMVLGRADTPLRQHAQAALVLPRIKSEHVALHAQSMTAIEAMHLALSSRIAPRTLATLDRLLVLRSEIRPNSK